MTPEKSLGQIAAEGAGWTWDLLPASARAEWQREAEAVAVHIAIHIAEQREKDILRAHKKFPTR